MKELENRMRKPPQSTGRPKMPGLSLSMVLMTALILMILPVLSGCGSKQEFSTDVLRINDAFPKVRFLIHDSSITVFDVSGKKPEQLQELSFGEVTDPEFSKEMFAVEDMNFDGSGDIRLPSLLGASNAYSYVWLWDESANGFVYNEQLSNLSLLMTDPDNKILTTAESNGAAEHIEAAYDWVDGKLTLLWQVRTLSEIGTENETVLRTERQPDGSYALKE